MKLISKKNSILIYVVSNSHILNAIDIADQLTDNEVILIYEKNLNSTVNQYSSLKYININEYNINKFFKLNHNNISSIIFSTCQLRKTPIKILYNSIIFDIPTIAFQETHQMYLHNSKMNNYLLPVSKILLSSNFEKNEFIKLGYSNNKIIVTGWYYNKNKYKNLNKILIDNKYKNILIILNSSNINNSISIENYELQTKIIKRVDYYLKGNYKIYVKIHPVDYIYFKKSNIQNMFKKINFIIENVNIYDLLNKVDCILLTGYSQLFIESLILNKKVFILNYENQSNHVKDFKYIINKNENIFEKINSDYKYDFKKIYEINNIEQSIKNSKKNIINEIVNLQNIKNLYSFNDYIQMISIINLFKFDNDHYLLKSKFHKYSLDDYNKLVFNEFNTNKLSKKNYLFLLNHYSNCDNIYYILKYQYLDFIIKNKINLTDDDCYIFQKNEPTYYLNTFYNEKQRLINLLLYYKRNDIISVIENNHYDLINHMSLNRSLAFRIFIKLRKLVINNNIILFNRIFFIIYEFYYKYIAR